MSGKPGDDGGTTSVIDDLNAAWGEIESGGGHSEGGEDDRRADQRDAGAEGKTDSGVSQEIDNSQKTGENESSTGERQRDDRGRFAKKDEEAADPKASADPAKATAADPKAGEAAEGKQAPPAADGPPSNWSDISTDDWGKVPAAVRSKITARETQIAQGFQQINQGLAPLLAETKARGIPWQEGLQRLTQAQGYLDKDPHGALIWLAKNYGVDLDDLAEIAAGTMQTPGAAGRGNGNGNAGHDIPPAVDTRLAKIEATLNQTRLEPLLREVQTFAKSVDFFEDLTPQINALLPSIRAMNPNATHTELLKSAYSAAVAVNPAIQARIAEKAKAKAEADARARAEAERGNRGRQAAGVHLQGSPGASSKAGQLQSVGSVHDDLAATWEELTRV